MSKPGHMTVRKRKKKKLKKVGLLKWGKGKNFSFLSCLVHGFGRKEKRYSEILKENSGKRKVREENREEGSK